MGKKSKFSPIFIIGLICFIIYTIVSNFIIEIATEIDIAVLCIFIVVIFIGIQKSDIITMQDIRAEYSNKNKK